MSKRFERVDATMCTIESELVLNWLGVTAALK